MNKPVIPQPKDLAGEFRRFITKTNAIALAIGIIIGGAATKLVSALVEDLINPIVGLLVGNVDLANLKIVLGSAKNADGKVIENAILYGSFISTLVDFVIIMAVVYILIKIFAKDMLDK